MLRPTAAMPRSGGIPWHAGAHVITRRPAAPAPYMCMYIYCALLGPHRAAAEAIKLSRHWHHTHASPSRPGSKKESPQAKTYQCQAKHGWVKQNTVARERAHHMQAAASERHTPIRHSTPTTCVAPPLVSMPTETLFNFQANTMPRFQITRKV